MPVSDGTYDIMPYRLATWMLGKINRKGRIILFLKALLFPLIDLHSAFIRYRNAKRYQLMITGQVCWLERLLNDRYDFTERRISIGDAEWHQPWYIYQEEELKPEWLYTESEAQPVYLYSDGEAGELKDDFTVLVPLAIEFNMDEIKGVIDSYRIFGTKYKIERV